MATFRGRLIGLVALLALSITQAHSVWALCCTVERAPVAAEHLMAGDHHAADHHAAPHGQSPAAPQHVPMPGCPSSHAGALGGCAVVAALPTIHLPAAGLPPELGGAAISTTTIPFLLLGLDLFRPPRA